MPGAGTNALVGSVYLTSVEETPEEDNSVSRVKKIYVLILQVKLHFIKFRTHYVLSFMFIVLSQVGVDTTGPHLPSRFSLLFNASCPLKIKLICSFVLFSLMFRCRMPVS